MDLERRRSTASSVARWGGTAGVVNQAAAVQGPATSQHQGLTSPLTS